MYKFLKSVMHVQSCFACITCFGVAHKNDQNNNNAFHCLDGTITTWNFVIVHFMDDIKTGRRVSFSFSEREYGP